jgi:outer membrane protein TolC
LENSRILRDSGGRVLTNPQSAQSTFDPSIRETDTRQGTIAAEAAYDAQFHAGADWIDANRFFNNVLIGGGANQVAGTQTFLYDGIDKRTATGGSVGVTQITGYTNNNAPANTFDSLWGSTFVGSMTQPLLRDAGIQYNQIAGPSGVPGVYSGVLIARTNTDIALADLEAALRNYLLDTERAYWELYYAYHDLDARIASRNAALELWRNVQQKLKGGIGADPESEARAREQYYLLQAQVENSLSGTINIGSTNASQGGSGVQVAERRLRWLLGLPISDKRLIRPSSDPPPAEIVFNWKEALQESLTRRVELRKQKTIIKRRELELIASRNFLKPKLDLVALYAQQGFGQDLLAPQSSNSFNSALGNLVSTQHSHFSVLGLQYSQAIGNRIGHSQVRNAELVLAREKAILAEQELQVAHELSDAFAEAERSYQLTRTTYNRRAAAEEQLVEVTRKYQNGAIGLDPVLDAQRRLADAGSGYYRSVVDYNRALAEVHYARGTLLDYDGVFLSEGPWPVKALSDAARQSGRVVPTDMNYCFVAPHIIARQPLPQLTLPPPQTRSRDASTNYEALPEVVPTPSTSQPEGDSDPGLMPTPVPSAPPQQSNLDDGALRASYATPK